MYDYDWLFFFNMGFEKNDNTLSFQISAYWRDTMNSPLDEAVHWVEYVIKHDGAKHLKAAATELNFIQFFLLDVILTILVFLALVYYSLTKTFRLLCKKSKSLKKSKTN